MTVEQHVRRAQLFLHQPGLTEHFEVAGQRPHDIVLGERAAIREHIGHEQQPAGDDSGCQMAQSCLPACFIRDVIEHVEHVDDIERSARHAIGDIGAREALVRVTRRQLVDTDLRDVEPGVVRATAGVELGPETRAAADVQHTLAAHGGRGRMQRPCQHVRTQRVARLVVGQRQCGLAGATQVELLRQALLPELLWPVTQASLLSGGRRRRTYRRWRSM